MKKLVILYPIHFEQISGGAELQVYYLARRAINEHFEVHFIYEDNEKAIKNEISLILHPLKKKKVVKGIGQRWVLYKKLINKVLTSINPDVVYTRFGSSWVGFASDYCIQSGAKHIHAVASDNDIIGKIRTGFIARPLNYLEARHLKRGLKYASNIIVQNRTQHELLLLKLKRSGVLVNQMTPLVNELSINKPVKPIKVLWIGNIKKVKRPEIFIELANLLNIRGGECNFLMAGRISKNYTRMIHNSVQNNPQLTFLGELTQEQVFNLLCESHLLINTSEYEGFSNTFVQAWMRKVIVLSMNSNPSEIITKEQIGFICPTVIELCAKVELLLKDNLLRDEMAQKSYEYCKANHSLENNIEKVISLLNSNE